MDADGEATTRERLAQQFRALGVARGETLMVHASIRAVGTVAGGAPTILQALLDSVGRDGTLMGFASWQHSPYEETLDRSGLDRSGLDGSRLDAGQLTPAQREVWPAFDPSNAPVYAGFGMFNELLRQEPGSCRSPHPDASMVAIGPRARWLTQRHDFDDAYGPTSPLARLVQASGRVLLLGAPLDAVTVLHLAEALARIPGKRRVSYEMPILDAAGHKQWMRCGNFDSNGILDRFAQPGQMDAVETIARAYVEAARAEGRPYCTGMVGDAHCHLLDARDLVAFGVRWLEDRFAAPGG